MTEEIQAVLEAVCRVFGRDGCACIKDMAGDNYTCTACQTLFRYANKEVE